MPHNQTQWIRRIKAAEREHYATRLAIQWLLTASERDPTVLQGKLTPRDLRSAADRLDGTYLIRLFSEFESGLRHFWSSSKNTNPPVRDLLDGIAARRQIPRELLDNIHAVRAYRNRLACAGGYQRL